MIGAIEREINKMLTSVSASEKRKNLVLQNKTELLLTELVELMNGIYDNKEEEADG